MAGTHIYTHIYTVRSLSFLLFSCPESGPENGTARRAHNTGQHMALKIGLPGPGAARDPGAPRARQGTPGAPRGRQGLAAGSRGRQGLPAPGPGPGPGPRPGARGPGPRAQAPGPRPGARPRARKSPSKIKNPPITSDMAHIKTARCWGHKDLIPHGPEAGNRNRRP